ncbi:MAG: YihY/virulence factor BrkB family protein [Xanthomonadales bacterium]|nr:YihY/virulence factor BrkB family protein [Xanthomonadales bacterium]
MSEFLRFWFKTIQRAVSIWLESQAFVYAAALAFFTVFSIAPVVIVAVAVVGLVLGEDAATGQIMIELEGTIGPQAAEFVQVAVQSTQVDSKGLWPTVLGVGLIILGATTVFGQMQNALNAIWDVIAKPSRSGLLKLLLTRLMSLTMLLVIGFVLLVSLLLSIVVRALVAYAQDWLPVGEGLLIAADLGLSVALATLLFGAIFRILPDVVLSFRDVLLGALVTALLFTLGRSVIGIYLANSAASSAYGAAGSLVLLLMWVNYSSLILLFGAAFTRAHLEAAGRMVIPRRLAIRVHRQLIEDDD